jgi:2',3'-cyclic-nucleotide 2'-phosphodiesterase (5'-nucleotidase family)
MLKSHLWAIACILVISSSAALDADASSPRELAILATSNLQSQVVPFKTTPDGPPQGGLERISALSKKVKATADGALLLSMGDDLMGPFYHLFGGEPEMRAMTLAGYDAVCPGSHEFDRGWRAYLNATKHAGFLILCANLEIQDPEFRSAIRPSMLLNVSGIEIGLFGLIAPDLPRMTQVDEDLSVNTNVESVASEQVSCLRRQGADLVIAISHMGSVRDEDLARKVSGIDLIAGGHDQAFANTSVEGPDGWRTLVVQHGMGGESIGLLRCTCGGRGGGIENPSWEIVVLNESLGYDPAVREYLAPFVEDYQNRLSREIGSSAVDLDARERSMRSREMPLGNLIADAWLAWFRQADLAAVNGGGVRGDRIYSRGPISYLTLKTILPFDDTLVLVNMTGMQIKQMLEVSAAALDPGETGVEEGAFLQVAGIRFKIDRRAQPFVATYDGRNLKEMISPGSRVREIFLQKNGTLEPLDEQKEYQVLISSWTAQGGDGFYLFEDMPAEKKFDTTVLDWDPVAAYIEEKSPVYPKEEGRIEIA